MSKSSRRRQRKSKQKAKIQNKKNCNYADKFKIIEKDITDLLVCAYIRQIQPHGRVNMVPYEIQKLCGCYFNDESIKTEWIDTVILPLIRKITYEQEPSTFYKKQRIEYEQRKKNNKLKITKSILKFNDTFNQLTSYDKRLVCKRIIKQKYPIYKLTVWPIENDNKTNAVFNQLYYLEYILCKRYNTLNYLDLSEMNLNDNHVLYLCNSIENLIKYNIMKKQQRIKESKSKAENNSSEKHSKQKPDKKLQNKSKVKNQIQNSKKTNNKPVYSKNKRAQREIERQLEKMKQMKKMKQKEQKPVEIKMKLKTIDLSLNDITDKHMSLLLRMIKKRMCGLETLDLSSNKITNKSLSIIMKYNIKRLKIELSNCKGVTLKGLNKYQRTDYDNETPLKYIYCENMVYFVNEKEESEKENKPKGGKFVRGKGRKMRGNRKRMLYTGMDGIETGYLSTDFCDWWNYQ